jgi:hypothetical protein
VVVKMLTDIKSRMAYLRRLSVVFAIELRLKIVTELYLREMSPTQFYGEFGGGSVSRVDRNFKRLAEHGWLELIRSESGGDRRGGVENFYRATELAVFDNETWALVPYSIRVAFSWRTFKTLAERVRDALKANTLDARADSHLSWTTMGLDQVGWERMVAAIDALFESLFAAQEDAKLRIFHSGEKPMLATVALTAFESPTRPRSLGDERVTPRLVETCKDSPVPFPLRVSKVFRDELCVKIVAEANLREISAPLFHAELGGDTVERIRRRFKVLEENEWLKKTEEKTGGKRRGAREHFYRATGPAIFDKEDWADVPNSIKPSYSWMIFKTLGEKVKEAILAGTFEARLDNHLSWSVLRLDQQGWEDVAAAIAALFALVLKEQEDAEDRIARSGEKPITTTIGLAAFESPKTATKEP